MDEVTNPRIRILVVDDHSLFRRGVWSLLQSQSDFDVVGEAATGREAEERARELMPDVILMDVSMPEGNGMETTRRIKDLLPYIRIVMLTASDEERDLFEAVKSGAQGYLLKKIQPEALFATVRGVMRGEASISHSMAAKILGEFSRLARGEAEPPYAVLTPRERAVLELIAQGKTNKEVACALSIAENTAKNHLRNILEKLHLENRVQAATFALRHNLTDKPGSVPFK
jgi:DNA-binding NarL/FixJ family response regulator